MRILLVTEDAPAAINIRTMLQRDAFQCDMVDAAAIRSGLAQPSDYDVLVLDGRANDGNAGRIVRRVRAHQPAVPILLLAEPEQSERSARRIGLDNAEVLTRPFHRRDVTRRIMQLVERCRGQRGAAVQTGRLTVSLLVRRAEVDGRRVHLTRKEYAILELLSRLKGVTVTRGMLLAHLYDGVDDPGPKIIDVFICKLRERLARATGGETYISSVRGRGYVLGEPAAVTPPPAIRRAPAAFSRPLALDRHARQRGSFQPKTAPWHA